MACVSLEVIIKSQRPLSTIYSLRLKIYHIVCFLTALVELGIISTLGTFGFSNLSNCSIQSNSEGKYLLIMIFCVNLPIMWGTAFTVLNHPVSRKNKIIKHIVLVGISVSVTWGIPTLALLVPANEIFDSIATLLACISGTVIFLSRMGSRNMFKVIKQIFTKPPTRSFRKLATKEQLLRSDTLIINQYINEELSLANFLDNFTKNTTINILIGVSLIFLTNFTVACQYSYSYKKKKYVFGVDHFKVLEDLIGKQVFNEESTFEIWEYEHDIFESIRKSYGWSDNKITDAFCDKNNFKYLENTNRAGRSSAFIFNTYNTELVIKTITKQEKYLMLEILGRYHERMVNCRDSRIVRILGLYKMKNTKQPFIIMENLLKFKEKAVIFDLKGSLNDRYTIPAGDSHGMVLKDQNLIEMKKKVILDIRKREEIVKAIDEDAIFFRDLEIIDYSLLIAFYSEKVDSTSRYIVEGDNQFQYSMGVIDFLQQFTLSKKLELAYKKMKCKKNLSVCPPDKYAARFIEFISQIFE